MSIGVTKKYVVGVWVGNADGEGRPGLVGVQTAAPILFDVFKPLARVLSSLLLVSDFLGTSQGR